MASLYLAHAALALVLRQAFLEQASVNNTFCEVQVRVALMQKMDLQAQSVEAAAANFTSQLYHSWGFRNNKCDGGTILLLSTLDHQARLSFGLVLITILQVSLTKGRAAWHIVHSASFPAVHVADYPCLHSLLLKSNSVALTLVSVNQHKQVYDLHDSCCVGAHPFSTRGHKLAIVFQSDGVHH